MKIYKLFLQLLLVVSLAYSSSTPPQSLLIEQQQLETNYENIITSTLRKYYDPNSFIVDVRIDIVGDKVSKRIKKIDTTISQLPGLPTLPSSLKQNNGVEYDTISDIKFKLGKRTVTIVVDTNYSFKDYEFIREAVIVVANLDEKGGDNIVITKKQFPRTNRAVFQDFPQEKEQVSEDSSLAPAPTQDDKDNTFPFWIVVLVLLIIIAIVYLLFKKIIETIQNNSNDDSDIREALTTVIQKVEEMQKPVIEDESVIQIQELKSFLLDTFLSKPSGAASVFKSWIENDQNEVNNVASLIYSVDKELFNSISTEFPPNMRNSIEWHISQENSITDDELLKLLKLYKKDFFNITKEVKDTNSDIFNFLNQLSHEQLLQLINSEEDGVKAVILAQIPADKASRILQNLEAEQRTTVLRYMGKLSKIPMDSYKKLAAKLAKKAMALSNMKYVVTDGIQRIIDLLFSLPISEQESYIHSLAETDLDLVIRVRRFFVSYSELTSLPRDILQAVLHGVKQEDLVLSLISEDNERVKLIISVLPERMQQMVVSSIAAQRNNTTITDIENARLNLIRQAYKELKKRGGREV